MNKPDGKDLCAAGCAACELGAPGGGTRGVSLQGWRLAVGASGAFGIPVVLAAVGAVAGGGHQADQVIGAAVGFAAGMALAGVVVRLIRPEGEEDAWQRR